MGMGHRGLNRGADHIRTHHHASTSACGGVIDIAVFANPMCAQIMGVQLPFARLQRLASQACPKDTGKKFGEQGQDTGLPDISIGGRVLHQFARLERGTHRLTTMRARLFHALSASDMIAFLAA